ncbi:hypothetical protein SAMD00023353_7700020 [Rosellinia necatrix]|uniref:Uncharacterized protein n=1 Tax=Rosellinia necatrix TaxID=77044 RepID=A0A1S8AB52_ROSNE|nr:hypothetical protein SAMD00023353_7700020 [Rosellinia necatrix]
MSNTSDQDAHKGGDLSEMAKDGTKIPGDAGKMNITPSKPSPQQAENDLGATSLNTAAENAVGSGKADDEAISASGHSIPSSMFEKPGGRR